MNIQLLAILAAVLGVISILLLAQISQMLKARRVLRSLILRDIAAHDQKSTAAAASSDTHNWQKTPETAQVFEDARQAHNIEKIIATAIVHVSIEGANSAPLVDSAIAKQLAIYKQAIDKRNRFALHV